MKMKKIKKFILKGLPVFLAVLFILQLVPRHFYAAAGARLANFFAGNETWSVNRQEPPLLSEEVSEPSLKEDLSILGELTEKRTADTKYFRMSDGSFQALQYPQAVHYEADGTWIEYDNTLLPDAAAQELTAASSDAGIHLSKKTNGKKFVRIEKDGYKLSWYYEGAAKREGRSTSATDDGDPSTLERIRSEVRYDGIFPDVDLQYLLDGGTLKENLILHSRFADKTYSIGYQCTGLSPVQKDERTIYLNNEAGETVFVIYAPYLEDAAHAVSAGVTLSLTEIQNGKFTVKMELDAAWLEAPSRAYPVTVDPVLLTSQSWNDTTNCESAYIASGTPNACYGRGGADYEGSLHVGQAYDRGQCRALIKTPNLPELGVADKVIHAELALYTTECYPDIRVDLHRVTSPWSQSSVCWNSNVKYDSKIIDYQLIQTMDHGDANRNRWQRFEITDLVRGWYSGEFENNGVLLRSDAETGASHARAWFLSSGYPSTSAVRPVLQIAYRNMSGYEDYWSYTNVEAGRGGVLSVNNYNGNLVFTQPVTIDAGGSLMPVSLSVILNANGVLAPHGHLSNFVQTNYHIYVRYDDTTAEHGFKYFLNDADGTRHWFYFEENSNTGKDEDGLGYTLEVTPSVSESDGVNTRYTITDKDKNKMYFNGLGNLTKITNAVGNSVTVQYETAGGAPRMKTIQDGAGRTYTFGYNAANPTLCESITDPAGRKTIFGYYQGTLTWLTFPDGRSYELVYDYNDYVLVQVKSIDGTWVKIGYDGSEQKRVSWVKRGSGNDVLEQYSFSYKQNATTVTDKQNRSYTYQFNDYGQTTGIVSNQDGTAQFFELEPGNSTSRKANKLLSESRVVKSITNYLINPGFTRAASDGYSQYVEIASGTRITAIDSGLQNVTKNSLKVTKSASNGGRLFQYQDVTGIPAGRYTLSGYINTGGVKLPGNGAYLGIELRNSAGVLVDVAHIEETLKTDGWERRSVTFDLPAGHSLRIVAGFEPQAYGTVWFDDLQLEKGTGESSFNLVENSTFLQGTANWESENGKAVTWNYGGPSGYERCAKAPGTTEERYKNIIQSLEVSGKAGDVFHFGMWVSADSAPIDNDTKTDDAYWPAFKIVLHYYDTISGSWKGCVTKNCNPDLKGSWQFVTSEAVIPVNYSRLAIHLIYDHNVNNAYITGAFCYKEAYGQTYDYDSQGNVVSSVDLANTRSDFAYYGSVMGKLLNPSGSRYLYTYDEKQQLTYALSSDGQQYSFTYDAKGNITNAVVTARKPATVLETGKEYYIFNAFSGLALDSGWRGMSQKVSTFRFMPAAQAQRWRLEAVAGETGVYKLRAMQYDAQNYYLDVSDALTADGSLLGVHPSNTAAAQKFKIVKKQENTYAIYTGPTNYEKLLDGQYDAGNEILLSKDVKQNSEGSGTLAEGKRWYFYPVEATEGKEFVSSAAYTNSGNFVSAITDERGNTTYYDYTESKGLLDSVTDPLNRVTNYTYDANSRLTGVSSQGASASYSYENDFLSEIRAGDTVRYQFFYDQFGRPTDIKVGNGTTYRTLTGKTYNAAGLLSRLTYGNGDYSDYTYDSLDRLTEWRYNGEASQRAEYAYGSDGRLSQTTDYLAGTRTRYIYDLAGRITSIREYEGTAAAQNQLKTATEYTYADKTNNLTGLRHFSELGTQSIGFRYGDAAAGEMPDRIYGVTWNGAEKQSYTYDGLGRLTNRQLKPSASITLNHSYTYADAAGNKTTSLVETLTTAAGTYTYTYDAAGNILSISDGAYLLSYQYDGLNRLIRENDERAGKTYTYEYAQGNITKKKEYAYTTGTVSGTPLNVTEWEYGNAEWGDLLTNWNGQPLEYDSIGNLTAFGTEGAARRELFWNGRQLKSIRLGQGAAATNILYEYNSDGLRISRTTTDADEQAAVTKYIYNGDILAGEIRDDGKSLLFYYDNNGQPFGLRYNGTDYYYLRNLQNDVAAIADGTGAIAARYYYDAWGNLLSVTDGAGHAVTDAEHIGLVNPIRYRGYYYDSETGYYYVSSRYYDPEIGRWISPEPNVYAGAFDSGSGLIGYNVYAYCANNPVNFSDPTGEFILTALIVGVVAGAVIGGAIGGTVAYNSAKSSGLEGSDLFWATAGGVGKGALIGGVAGGLVGATGGVVAAYGATSVAGTAMITATATITAKATEVTALQAKKSTNDGDNGWQIANDCIDSIFGNGGKIISPALTKAGTTSATYVATDLIKHKVVPLGFNTFLHSTGGKVLPYGFAAYAWGHTAYSIFCTDPIARANQRGYGLR